MNSRPAIVLLSGGLDSTTCLAIARHDGFAPVYSMSFDYGQRHRQELRAAERIARACGVAEHRVITIDLRQFGQSALTDDIDVPKDGLVLEETKRQRDGETKCAEETKRRSDEETLIQETKRRSDEETKCA